MFITFCTRPRRVDQLANARTWTALSEASAVLGKAGKMGPLILLAMPDHVHLLARVPREVPVKSLVRSLKTAVSREQDVDWQPGFFDHRVRGKAQIGALIEYVRMNPVRAGLCEKSEDWPYLRKAW